MTPTTNSNSNYKDVSLTKKLSENQQQLKTIFNKSNDIIFRDITIHEKRNKKEILLVFTDGLVNSSELNESIIKPLNHFSVSNEDSKHIKEITIDNVTNIINTNEISKVNTFDELIQAILSGDTIMIIDGYDIALKLNSKGWAARSVEEPSVESVVRGSRDGFTENIRNNTAMIRRKIKDPSLKIEEMTLGSRTNTFVSAVYMEGIVDKDLLSDVLYKLKNIEIDGIFESGYIEQLLEQNHFTPFPQMQITERPDKACGNLLEGRIVIIIDGAPQVILLPTTFAQLFQSPEDYNERFLFGNLLRLLRYFGFFIATSLPAIYVAFISFHVQMLPSALIVDLSKTRAQVPFPPVVEAILMEFTIELLREASARLPGTIGQTIGIVGAIVIGDAAVRANIASPTMVIVVAVTALGSYVLPHYSTSYALRAMRFPMILMAATFGAFGIIITWTWIIIHLCTLNSFGYPFLAPFAPISMGLFRDAFFRLPLKKLKKRSYKTKNT